MRAGQWLAQHLGLPVVLLSDVLFQNLGGGQALEAASAQNAPGRSSGSGVTRGGSSSASGSSGRAAIDDTGAAATSEADGSSGRNTAAPRIGSVAPTPPPAAAAAATVVAGEEVGDDLLDELLSGAGGSGTGGSGSLGSTPPASASTVASAAGALQRPLATSASSPTQPLRRPGAAAPSHTAAQALAPTQRSATSRPVQQGNAQQGQPGGACHRADDGDDLLDDVLCSSNDVSPLPPAPSQQQRLYQRQRPGQRTAPPRRVSDGDDLADELFGSSPPRNDGAAVGGGSMPASSALRRQESAEGDDLLDELFSSSAPHKASAAAARGSKRVSAPQGGQQPAAAPRPRSADSDDLLDELFGDSPPRSGSMAATGGSGTNLAATQQRPQQPAAPSQQQSADSDDLLDELFGSPAPLSTSVSVAAANGNAPGTAPASQRRPQHAAASAQPPAEGDDLLDELFGDSSCLNGSSMPAAAKQIPQQQQQPRQLAAPSSRQGPPSGHERSAKDAAGQPSPALPAPATAAPQAVQQQAQHPAQQKLAGSNGPAASASVGPATSPAGDLLDELMADDAAHREAQRQRGNPRQRAQASAANTSAGIEIAEVRTKCPCNFSHTEVFVAQSSKTFHGRQPCCLQGVIVMDAALFCSSC